MGGPWSWWSWTPASWTRAQPQTAQTKTHGQGLIRITPRPHLPCFAPTVLSFSLRLTRMSVCPPPPRSSHPAPHPVGSKVEAREGLATPPASQVLSSAHSASLHPPPIHCGLGASSNHSRLFHPPTQQLHGGGGEQNSDSTGDILSPTPTLITAADSFFMSVFSLFAPATASEPAPGTPGRAANPAGEFGGSEGVDKVKAGRLDLLHFCCFLFSTER